MRSQAVAFVLLFLLSLPVNALDPVFQYAQRAAGEGRYEDVVSILSDAIESGRLENEDLAVAHSNRGIAYSLLERFGPAVQDLNTAIRINPAHGLSLNHLGVLAEHVQQDFEAARQWYEQAAEQGYSASLVNLGNLYRQGKGVAQDDARAVQLFRRALMDRYEGAAVALGEMYLTGRGVTRDFGKARELLEAGVDAGEMTGHFGLGRMLENGWGIERNYRQAAVHYRLGATAGHAPAQGALGYLYRTGRGVTRDYNEAVRWYEYAADQGDVQATNRLAWLLATCPTEDICDGQRALVLAGRAVDTDPSQTNFDTLAAAHARVGNFDRAIAIMSDLLALDLSGSSREQLRRRLEHYRNGIPVQLR